MSVSFYVASILNIMHMTHILCTFRLKNDNNPASTAHNHNSHTTKADSFRFLSKIFTVYKNFFYYGLPSIHITYSIYSKYTYITHYILYKIKLIDIDSIPEWDTLYTLRESTETLYTIKVSVVVPRAKYAISRPA